MKLKTLLFFSILILFIVGCNFNNSSEDINNSENLSRVIFTLTDAPNDELSVLQVELTKLSIFDVDGIETLIFSEEDSGTTFVLNLLNLQDLNALLGSVPMEPGFYKSLSLSYKNATALDTEGNVLTVKENHYGTAKVNLNPYLQVTDENVYIEIDFDLNNSVFNIVSGPHGSILLMPTLVVKIGTPENSPELDEFKGIVESVASDSMIITVNGETLNILVTDDTVIEVDEIIITPKDPGFDLFTFFIPTNMVEIYGTLDVATNTVTAVKIERKFENHGLEFQGIVVSLTDASFDVLVLRSRDSGFALGSVQTITFDANTFFLYTDPSKAASFDKLALGQDVRVTGLPTDASIAQKVKLKETKLVGTIVSLDPATGTLVLTVSKSEGIDITKIPLFVNPITVEFIIEFPTDLKVGAEIKLEGFFNRETDGTFSVYTYDPDDDNEEITEENGETVPNTWVGKTFTAVSSSEFTITRGGDAMTATVVLASGVKIIEKDRSETTDISASALFSNINSDKYDQMKAKGLYNKGTNILTADLIVMTVKKK